jgi:branched-chain amino acid transport system substrate-binding protein
MINRTLASIGLGLAVAVASSTPLEAEQTPLKIGILWGYSAGDPAAGQALDTAIAVYMKQHGDTIAGRKVVIVKRDSGAPSPETARRLAQELVVGEQVDFIAGLAFTPEATAVAQITTEGKKPTLILNAAGSGIMANAPYMTRWSGTNAQMAVPLAQWALKNGIKTSYVVVSDYGPGIDAGAAYTKAFTAGGGVSAGEARPPMSSTDYTAYVQHIHEAKPDAIFLFLPAGPPSLRFLKAFHDAGLDKSVKILAIGGVVDDDSLPALGDSALGVISAFNYTPTHDSPANREFVRDFKAIAGPTSIPDFAAISAYDAIAAIYRVVAEQRGGTDPDKAMATLRGYKAESPRGPIAIDPATRDIVQNIYIRRVERKNGILQNTEIATYPAVKDPTEH